MESPHLPYAVPIERQSIDRDTLESLRSLLYLIAEDATHPERVKAYVEQAERVLERAGQIL
jgi:hypothetical protein